MLRWDLISWNRLTNIIFQKFTLRLFIPYGYLVYSLNIWSSSTDCYRRFFLINFIMLHIIFIHPKIAKNFDSITVILFFLWVIEIKNNTNDNQCIDYHEDNFLMLSYFLFKLLLWTTTISLGIFIIILAGSIIREFFRRSFHNDQEVSEELMNKLPLLKYRDYNAENLGSTNLAQNNMQNIKMKLQEICAICLEKFSEDEELALMPKCKHAFHYGCIKSWIASNKHCPYCRREIFENKQDNQPDSQGIEMHPIRNNSSPNENLENLRNVLFYINP